MFLTQIPDQSLVGNLIPTPISQITEKHSNSLIDQIHNFQKTGQLEGGLED